MIHFVGAGSGAVDLITIRGAELLKEADVIIYAGSLVNPDLLNYAKESCEIYDSAKMTLDEVLEVMFDAEKENKMTVRLHTGDSSIYGAIREQMDRLDEEEISYDVCPGVSSFCGAAASLKAEYTLPDVSQSVIITRPEGRTPKPAGESIASFSKHHATMCIFLGISMIDKVVDELLEGYTEDTPVAVVKKATWPDQEIIRGTLKDIAGKVKDANITKTAMIVVGDVLDPGDFTPSKLYDANFKHEYR